MEMEQEQYFFVVEDSEQAEDQLEVNFADEAARKYANRIINLLKDADGYDYHGLVMVVRNNAGRTVFSAPF
jgi:hypothetical protein